MTMPDSVPALLRAAAAVIRERGWWKGSNEGPEGQVCLFGAINVAAGGDPEGNGFHPPLQAALLCACDILEGTVEGDVDVWNDAPQRTVDEVLALLEGAAVLEEERLRHDETPGDPRGQGEDQEPGHV